MKKPTKNKSRQNHSTLGERCEDPLPDRPRRSIPVAEVDEMLNRQAERLTRPPTPYDERLRLIREIEATEGERKYYYNQAKGLAVNIIQLQNELKAVNQQIVDELDFDAVR